MNRNAFLQNFNAQPAKARAGYQLTSYLTEGGQAWIFNAHHDAGDSIVKAFKKAQEAKAIAEFKDEARRLQALSASQHIIRVDWLDSIAIGHGRGRRSWEENYPYMAMEKADGGSVKERITRGPLDAEKALTYLVQAMEGMCYAHAEDRAKEDRVVHRDIKPANLLIVSDAASEVVKVADFGIAVTGHASEQTITETQEAMGSTAYMAPEQFNGRAVLATDIYAMAATGYQMVTGQLPIRAAEDTPYAWYAAHQDVMPKQYPMLLPDGKVNEVAMAMQESLLVGLNKLPADRHLSMGSFQASIIEAAERGRQLQLAARTHIDLGESVRAADETTITLEASYKATQGMTEPFTRTQLLGIVPEATQRLSQEETLKQEPGETEELPKPPESRKERNRRRFLGTVVGASIATVVGGVGYEYFIGNPEPDPNTGEKSEQELKNLVTTTKWLIERFKANGQDNDVFFLVRALIPVDHSAAAEYINKMPLDKASFLAADLAFYSPGQAEKIMKKYEAKVDAVGAARIAMALAFYGKQKPGENNSDFVSTVPTDPIRRQAMAAAERFKVIFQTNPDLQDAVNVARSYDYTYKYYNEQRDTAVALLDKLITAGDHTSVEALCRVIARDHYDAVKGCIDHYIAEAAKNNIDQDLMLGYARDLIIDLAPFNGSMAGDYLNQLAQKAGADYAAASDAIALALAPHNASTVASYVRSDNFKNTTRFPIGVAVARVMPLFLPEFKKRVSEPVSSWLNYSLQIDNKDLAQKAQDALKSDDTIKTYGYWLGTALLRSQTDLQK